jgi:phosphohistidine phosphatase
VADFERPLARRGRKACTVIAEFIMSNKLSFDLVLCSTAVRARETIELISLRSGLRGALRFDERIYDARFERLLEVIAQTENSCKTLLLVGHNPGFEDLLSGLTGERHELPTASLAKIKSKISKWGEIQEGAGMLEWVQTQKGLDQDT